jgi:hypothetical protein
MPMPADLVQTEPGLAVLRMAALLAEDDGALDEELLDAMAEHTARGALRATPAAAMWPELQRGLMARAPSRMLAALRACREVTGDADDLDLARAQAIATALGSQRWSAAGHA